MAVMGLRINGGGGGIDTSLGDTFIKALFGDADTEMQLARTRSQLANDEYQRNYTAALSAAAQEKALREQQEFDALTASGPIRGQEIYSGQFGSGAGAEAPVPVEEPPTLDELPDNIDLDTDYQPVPVEVGTPAEIPFSGSPVVPNELQGFTAPVQQTAIPGLEMPVAVGAETDTYEPNVPAFGETVDNGDGTVTHGGANGAVRLSRAQADILGLAAAYNTNPEGQTTEATRRAALLHDQGLNLTPEQRVAMLAGPTPSNESIVGTGAGGPSAKAAQDLRKEIQGLPAYKDLADVVPVYDSMLRSSQLNTRAATMDLIYGIATLEDPGSVVREADSLMVQRTGGLSGAVQAAMSYFDESGELTPEMRANLMRIAGNRMGAYQDAFNTQVEQYRGIATRAGFELEDIIPDFGERGEYTPPLPPGVTEEQVQRYATDNNLTPEAARQILIDRANAASVAPAAPGGQ